VFKDLVCTRCKEAPSQLRKPVS